MSSIKEIARLANVSQGTASLVINGKGDQYRISAATQQKVWEAARQLQYQPNISARRLRSGGEVVLPIISLFWALDSRAVLISRFLQGLQKELAQAEMAHELLVQPFVGSRLHEVRSLVTGTRFNGAIIANPTEEDELYLEQTKFNVPIVLYQRHSQRHASVSVDGFASGQSVAELFASRGHRTAGLVVPAVSSTAIRQRMEGFLSQAAQSGMAVEAAHIMRTEYSEQGGFDAAGRLLDTPGAKPTALFVIGDQMAVGVLALLHERGVRVPEQLEVVGHDDDAVSPFTVPSLSTVHLPVEEMAAECVRQITGLIHRRPLAPEATRFSTKLVLRGSCGDAGGREDKRPQEG